MAKPGIFNSLLALALLCILQMNVPLVNATHAETAGWNQMSQNCQDKVFPISSGGRGNETVSCTVFDKVNEYIIVAGNSTSDDYVSTGANWTNHHAFAYAVDLKGNWMWGKTFTNGSYNVTTISGCHLDDNNVLVLLGQANHTNSTPNITRDQRDFYFTNLNPVIMEVSAHNGAVIKFLSLDRLLFNNYTMYDTHGAIYHDTSDYYQPSKAFYYVTFMMNETMHLLKINSEPIRGNNPPATFDISWNYEYNNYDSVDTWKNRQTPGFFHQDNQDRTKMYLFGRQNAKASIMKFNKNYPQQLDWNLEITEQGNENSPNSAMNEIQSFIQPEGRTDIYACGFSYVDAVTETNRKKAVMMKLTDDGEVQYMHSWGQGLLNQPDQCKSISYDYQDNQVILLIEATSPELRPDYNQYQRYSGMNSDSVIIIMKEGGTIMYGYNINYNQASISMQLASNSMYLYDQYFIFAGQSWGFKTRMQNMTYNVTGPTTDSFVFKWDIEDEQCIYSSNIHRIYLTQNGLYENINVGQNTKLTLRESHFLPVRDQFAAYLSSNYSSYELQQSFKYPRMCAAASINMTYGNDGGGVQYERGQEEISYWIGRQSTGAVAMSHMDNGVTWMFQNGISAEGQLGRFDTDRGGTVYVNTWDEELIGVQRTTLRGCSSFDHLYEVYLYINVTPNGNETTWTSVATPDSNTTESYNFYSFPTGGDSSTYESVSKKKDLNAAKNKMNAICNQFGQYSEECLVNRYDSYYGSDSSLEQWVAIDTNWNNQPELALLGVPICLLHAGMGTALLLDPTIKPDISDPNWDQKEYFMDGLTFYAFDWIFKFMLPDVFLWNQIFGGGRTTLKDQSIIFMEAEEAASYLLWGSFVTPFKSLMALPWFLFLWPIYTIQWFFQGLGSFFALF